MIKLISKKNRRRPQLRIWRIVIAAIFCLIFHDKVSGQSCADEPKVMPYDKYNVVMIFVDTLRADHLGCYGYAKKNSPNIDKIARESFIFKNNFAPASYTLPSFMSIITSLYPKSHGVLHIMKDKLSLRINTLAEILKIYKYKTAWFAPIGDPHLAPSVGFGRGFEHIGEFFNMDLPQAKESILHWVESHKNEKFFLNFHIYKPHAPYWPDLKYQKKFTAKAKKEIIMSEDELEKATFETMRDGILQKKGDIWWIMGEDLALELILKGLLREEFSYERTSEIKNLLENKNQSYKWDCLRHYVYISRLNFKDSGIKEYVESLYDALILELDTEVIAPLLKKLNDLGLYDKTILIICSDHGEEFGEHGGGAHGGTLYDEVIRVPLIIRVPWIKQGKQIQELTQTVDILPTLLDLLGIPVPYHAQGKSLLNVMRGEHALDVRKYVFSHHIYMSCIRSKEWKLILYQKGKDEISYLEGHKQMKELFHLPSDPGEQKNIYFQRRDVALRLESELKAWEDSLVSYREQEYPFLPHIDEAAQERIKRTGYW